MQRVLDSSPVILDPLPRPPAPRRSLKRTASLASLPTPPRTVSNKKRARKNISDEEEESSSAGESPRKPLARVLFQPKGVADKAAAVAKMAKEKEAEDIFWQGTLVEKPSPKEKKAKASSTIGSAPVSPPPSRSKQVGPRFQTPPPSKGQALGTAVSNVDSPAVVLENEGDGPIRDSPNNLFLVGSKAAYSPPPAADDPAEYEEPPTVTYVFRGKRQTFPNPLYNLPPEAHERSKLPLDHPDFSPSPSIRPKRLFAELTKRSRKAKKKSTPAPSPPSPIPSRSPRKAKAVKKRRAAAETSS